MSIAIAGLIIAVALLFLAMHRHISREQYLRGKNQAKTKGRYFLAGRGK